MDRRSRGKRKSSNCIQRCLRFSFLRFMADPEMGVGEESGWQACLTKACPAPGRRAQKQKSPDGGRGAVLSRGELTRNLHGRSGGKRKEKSPSSQQRCT